jgi:ribonuclease D
LDTETSSLDVMEVQVRLIQLKTEDGPPYLVDATAVGVEPLLEALADKHVLAHNAVYDLAVLKKNFGYEHQGPITCTMLTAQVLYGCTNKKANLQDLLARNLKVEISKDEQTSDWFEELSTEMLEYAARDVVHLHALREDLVHRIHKSNADLDWPVDLENRTSKVTASMLVSGMPVSEEILAACIEESRVTAEAQLDELDAFVKETLPEKFLKANRTNNGPPSRAACARSALGCASSSLRIPLLPISSLRTLVVVGPVPEEQVTMPLGRSSLFPLMYVEDVCMSIIY